MKLLLDQNLSHRIVAAVMDLFPGSAHVREFGMERADDEAIWDFALTHGFVIVSKDDDFHQRSFVRGHPPKVVWLRIGNCPTGDIITLLRSRSADLLRFADTAKESFLILSRTTGGLI